MKRIRIFAIAVITLATFVLLFHPSRALYMRHQPVAFVARDGVTLRGTLSIPRWRSGELPGVVVVHGSGPLVREHLRGDVRRLVRLGFAVLAYDKRGAGASGGSYTEGWGGSATALIDRLAGDAAVALETLSRQPRIDRRRIGYFGASQAGWIIPLAATKASARPAFQIILSGAAVSTGVEEYYSRLTGDGRRPPRVTDRREIERLVTAFHGERGFDPVPLLRATSVPTLWILGDHDASVPTFASVRALDAIRRSGNGRHTVIRYEGADHFLRDEQSGRSVPFWDAVREWLIEERVIAGWRPTHAGSA